MIEDIHEPVENYKLFFKDAHARNTTAFYEDLLAQSGVDEAANIKTVKELRVLEQKFSKESLSSKLWRALLWTSLAILAIGVIVVLNAYSSWWLVGLLIAFGPPIYKLNKTISDLRTRLAQLEKECTAKRNEAWQQMAPLNRLFDWDIVAKLIHKTVPRIELDPYFTNGRLTELQDNFGLNDSFNHVNRSIIFSHSGVINGNPFVLARTLDHWMGQKTYHGSLQISWTEWETDSKGHSVSVTRHETLHASLTKPYPSYGNRTFIIYGNEAAPDLSFTRSPSNLSKLDDGLINSWRKNRAEKALEKKSRDLKNSFSVMSNREFDSLFAATDRDHEVQFRLLFTPLAQQEMVNLLKDKQVGYGDDFEFIKQQMINLVESDHMMAMDISGNPEMFHAYELASSRKFFNDYHNNLFKSFFFGIAPILTIPLYQQYRSHADIYKDVNAVKSCFWEHEAIANYFGEKTFKHPHCVTNSILKTQSKIESDGTQFVGIVASGYGAVDRTDYVSVRGGDGYSHNVPVHWVEYFDVQRESSMLIKDGDIHKDGLQASNEDDSDREKVFEGKGINSENVLLRRSIWAALYPNA